MKQEGADSSFIYFKCHACGNTDQIAIGEGGIDANAAYALSKRELTGRLSAGLLDWRATQWDRLYTDLTKFLNDYDDAKKDIQLQMGLVACITRGFNLMDAEKFEQCKKLYKLTERMYKAHLKFLKTQTDPALYETVSEYKESRAKYKKCLNEYRNTKLAWKALFFVLKKIPLPFG